MTIGGRRAERRRNSPSRTPHPGNPSGYGECGFVFNGGSFFSELLEVDTANPPAAAASPAAAGIACVGPNAKEKLVVESAVSTSSGVQWRGIPGHPVRRSM